MNIQYNFKLPKEILTKLRERATKEYRTTSEVIRQLIIKYLKEKQNESSEKM